MRKLKSLSEFESFNDSILTPETQNTIIGGQVTANFHTHRTETCEWSCYDVESVTTQDGTVISTARVDTDADC
ncbi:hypothetical protein [Psychroserpens sp. MEBiC05023]